MNPSTHRWFGIAAVGITGLVTSVGCAAEDVNGGGLETQPASKIAVAGSDGGVGSCGNEPAPKRIDPSTLPTCCSKGPARCVPSADVAAKGRNKFEQCGNGGYCVPEVFLTEPMRKPTRCKSMNDADGACSSLCIPEVAQYESMLPQSVCGANERCVPCISPIDGKPTGSCDDPVPPSCTANADAGASATAPPSPPGDPSGGMRDCCHGRGFSVGKCVPRTTLKSEQLANLRPDVCAEADVCVPTEMMASSFVPTPCSVQTVVGVTSGVCLSACLDFGASAIFLAQGSCDAVHLCVPCKDPFGAPTGAPGCN